MDDDRPLLCDVPASEIEAELREAGFSEEEVDAILAGERAALASWVRRTRHLRLIKPQTLAQAALDKVAEAGTTDVLSDEEVFAILGDLADPDSSCSPEEKARFGAVAAFVEGQWQRQRQQGSRGGKRKAGFDSLDIDERRDVVRRHWAPGITLKTLAARIREVEGEVIPVPTLARDLKKLGLSKGQQKKVR